MSSHLFWSEVALSVFSLFVKLRNKFKFQKRTKDRRVADAFLHLFHKNNKQAEQVLSKADYVWILCKHCRQASPSECLSRSCSFAMSMSYHNHIFPFRVDIRGYVTLWLNDKHSLKWVKMRPHPLTGTSMLSIQTIILHAQVNTY